jgi:hypothetical protein
VDNFGVFGLLFGLMMVVWVDGGLIDKKNL